MEFCWIKPVLAGVDAAMAAVSWLILLCTYPDFAHWRAEGFAAAHEAYTRRVGWVVGPLLLAQLTGHVLIWLRCGDVWRLALVALAWALTGFWSVPCHRRLQAEGPSSTALPSLIRSHAWRTVIWSVLAVDSLRRASG